MARKMMYVVTVTDKETKETNRLLFSSQATLGKWAEPVLKDDIKKVLDEIVGSLDEPERSDMLDYAESVRKLAEGGDWAKALATYTQMMADIDEGYGYDVELQPVD